MSIKNPLFLGFSSHLSVQLEILDAFGQIDSAKSSYQSEYKKYRDIQKQIDALNADSEEDLERRIEFLDYRLNEIETPLEHTMPWFAQGRDFSDGVMSLKRKYLFFGEQKLNLKWDIKQHH